MRTVYLLVSVLFVQMAANAQVQFSRIRFAEALEKARTENKIVLLAVQSESCTQCNEVSKAGLNSAVLGRAVNSSCIALSIAPGDADYPLLDSLFSLRNSMGLLFVDADGSYLHRYPGTSSLPLIYIQELEKALQKKENPDRNFKTLQEDYNKGNRSFELLYQLAAKKNEAGIVHDGLTEEMLNLAPKDSAASLTFLQFLAEQIPSIGSKVEQYMHKDNRNFNDAWYLMSQQKRVSINTRIIEKSKNIAIRNKDKFYAERVAQFAAAVNSDRVQARKAHDKHMIDYYKAVNDTASYLSAAIKYYDQYLMTVSVDSVIRADVQRREEMLARLVPERIQQQANGFTANLPQAGIQFAPLGQYYTAELNSGAWAIYTYTHDPYYTGKALAWSKRSLEFFENAAAIDTYARLLYRTGNVDEAVQWLEKAKKLISEKKAAPYPNNQEELIQKMKAGDKKIDE